MMNTSVLELLSAVISSNTPGKEWSRQEKTCDYARGAIVRIKYLSPEPEDGPKIVDEMKSLDGKYGYIVNHECDKKVVRVAFLETDSKRTWAFRMAEVEFAPSVVNSAPLLEALEKRFISAIADAVRRTNKSHIISKEWIAGRRAIYKGNAVVVQFLDATKPGRVFIADPKDFVIDSVKMEKLHTLPEHYPEPSPLEVLTINAVINAIESECKQVEESVEREWLADVKRTRKFMSKPIVADETLKTEKCGTCIHCTRE